MSSSLAWVVVIPLAGAGWCLVAGATAIRCVTGATLVGTLLAAVAVARAVWTNGPIHHGVGGWAPPLGIELRADGIAAAMLVAVSLVGTVIRIGAPASRSGRPRRRGRGAALYLFALAALNALFVSADVFNLYVALELSTLAAVGMIAEAGDRDALGAAVRYLLIALPGSLIYLLGVALLFGEYATLDSSALAARTVPTAATGAAVALMIAGLSLKVAVFPLHGWLPAVYVASPYSVAALLSAVVGKAPYYVLLRGWMATRGAEATSLGHLLGAMGAASILWCSIVALGQQRLRPLLAYSSVAQVGYLLLAFPLATPSAWAGSVYFAFSHAAANGSMFLAAGVIERAVGDDDLASMKGMAGALPLTFASLALSGVSLMGMPPSGGFVAKWLLLRAALAAGHWWTVTAILAGGLLAAAYVFKILRGAFFSEAARTCVVAPPRSVEIAALALAVIAILLGLLPGALVELLAIGLDA